MIKHQFRNVGVGDLKDEVVLRVEVLAVDGVHKLAQGLRAVPGRCFQEEHESPWQGGPGQRVTWKRDESRVLAGVADCELESILGPAPVLEQGGSKCYTRRRRGGRTRRRLALLMRQEREDALQVAAAAVPVAALVAEKAVPVAALVAEKAVPVAALVAEKAVPVAALVAEKAVPVAALVAEKAVPVAALVAEKAVPVAALVAEKAVPVAALVAEKHEVEVPTVAPGSAPICGLYVEEAGRILTASPDGGSAVALMTEDFRVANGFSLLPVSVSEPEVLGQAEGDKKTSIRTLGVVLLHIHVPGTETVLAVRVLVVERLFTPFLLGRNVMDVIDEVYGRPSVWTSNDKEVSMAKAAYAKLQQGVPVVLEGDLVSGVASVGKDLAHSQVHRLVFSVEEHDLVDVAGLRVEQIAGFLDHDGQRSSALVPAAAVTAVVDWSDAGKLGSRRKVAVVADLKLVLDGAGGSRRLLKAGMRMGTFFLGRPVVAAAVVGLNGETQLVEDLIKRTLDGNDLLREDGDRRMAAERIRAFKMTEDLPEAGAAKADPFHITLRPGSVPFARRNYTMSVEEERFAEQQIRAWLKNGNLVESQSPWSSPVLIARHPRTGKLRFCVDYRALNAMTINDSYLLPRVEDIARAVHVSQAKVFSKIDLSQGFTQNHIHPGSQDYTSFRGPRHGVFKFAGGCFGLRNMPPAFQRLMDRVLGDMLWQRACVYVDDVLVFTKTLAAHHLALEELAKRFKEFNIYARASKCDFYKEEVEFLGYFLSSKGLRVLPDRVSGVIQLAVPASKEELRAFMGLTGQFRHLVFGYAEIAAPLEAMKHPQAKVPFDLSEGSVGLEAFKCLKLELLAMPTLAIPDMNAPFTFWADASEGAMSFVLGQEQKGQMQVIGFYSKAFVGNELKLGIPIKEAKALWHFVTKNCHQYLSGGGPHRGYVDSLSSGAVAKQTIKNPQLLRYAVDLSAYNLDIRAIPGKSNPADAPSRPPFVKVDPALERLKREGGQSPLCDKPGWRHVADAARHAEARDAEAREADVFVAAVLQRPDGTNATDAEMAADQRLDLNLAEVMDFILANRPSEHEQGITVDEQRRRIRLRVMSSGLVVTDTGVLVRVQSRRGATIVQTVIPNARRAALLLQAHTSSDRGGIHAAREAGAMLLKLQEFAWWWKMRAECLEYECAVCNVAKRPPVKPGGFIHSTVSGRPGEVVSCDWVPAPRGDHSDYAGYFLFCEKHSGAASAYLAKVCTAATALEAYDWCMMQLFLDVDKVVVDSASTFYSLDYQKGLKARGVSTCAVAAVQHQQANFVERIVQQVKAMLRATLDGVPVALWRACLFDLLRCYNAELSVSRGASPIFILTGWQPTGLRPYASTVKHRNQGGVFDSRELLRAKVVEELKKAQAVQAHYYNQRRVDQRFVEGDIVRLKVHRPDAVDGNFNLGPAYSREPFKVVLPLSEVTYIVEGLEKPGPQSRQTVHVSDLRLAVMDAEAPERIREEALAAGEQGVQYVVQRIHAHRQVAPAPRERDYLVQWGGYRDKRSFTWEPRSGLLLGAGEILRVYEQMTGLE
jgi:hypothetical protein